MLTCLGVTMLCFRTEPEREEFDADYSNGGFMSLRKRDSVEIKRRWVFSYLKQLCKVSSYLLCLELTSGEGTPQHTYYNPFTVEKWHSVVSLDAVCTLLSFLISIQLTAGLINIMKVFTQSINLKVILQTLQKKVSKCGLLWSIILEVVSDWNISFVV